MNEHRCRYCADDPQPENFLEPRRCAFRADGTFVEDNWNCAAIEEIASRADVLRGVDETIQIFSVPGRDDDGTYNGESYGWIVLTRYKSRGRVSSAVHVGDHSPAAVTFEFVDEAIVIAKTIEKFREELAALRPS